MRMTDHNCLWADKKPCNVCGYHPLYPDFDKALRYERQKQREILDVEDAEAAEREAAEIEARAELHRRRNSLRQQPDTDTDISPWRNHYSSEDGETQYNILTGERRNYPTREQWDLAEKAELEEYKRKRKLDPYLDPYFDDFGYAADIIDDLEGSIFDDFSQTARQKADELKDFVKKYGNEKPKKPTPTKAVGSSDVLSDEELSKEAARWSQGARPTDWEDTPDAVPRNSETVSISMRVPKRMLEVLREFARREDVGYQVLMKRWLDERIRKEAAEIKGRLQRKK